MTQPVGPDYWLDAPGCGGALTVSERLFIRSQAQQAAATFGDDCRIVNIGVDQGGTLYCLRAGAPDAELIGIDINPDSQRGDWQFIHGDSRRVWVDVGGPIHLLLIDGDHYYHGARADIDNWTPLVAIGGVVIFHDYGNGEKYPWTAGVKMAVDECMCEPEWEVVGLADSIKSFRRVTP